MSEMLGQKKDIDVINCLVAMAAVTLEEKVKQF